MIPTQTRASTDDRQRVLDATDIVRLIGDHLALKKKGREYVSLCPFHDDHKPSMCVVPHKQIYHCFSCGAGGNAFSFVMDYHKMSFPEALELLAERAGITLAPKRARTVQSSGPGSGSGGGPGTDSTGSDTPSTIAGESPRAALLRASSSAQTFFRTILQHPEHGKPAREVIARRAIAPDMVEQFALGAAPDRWDGLALTIQNKSLPTEPFLRAGLLKSRENSSGVYDAFRNRLIFPIYDQLGRVIAFGGRRLNDQDEPKYVNSSESPIFDKSSCLYGLHLAVQEIRRTRIAIITEGYMDTIACHQGGVKNAVATLGTAMTVGNARVLKRLCDTVVLLFDGDDAGTRAAQRAVEVFFAEPIDVRICSLSRHTDAKDPDELLKRPDGPSILNHAIAQSIDPLELLFTSVRDSIRQSAGGIAAQSRAVEEFTARLVDLGLGKLEPVRYQLVVRRLSEIAGVDWQTIANAITDRKARLRPRAESPSITLARTPTRGLTTAEHLLGCILCDPSLTLVLGEDDWELIEPAAFADPASSAVSQTIMDVTVEEQSPSLQNVLALCDDPEVQRAATWLSCEVDRLTQGDESVRRRHWNERLRDARIAKSALAHTSAANNEESSASTQSSPSSSASLAEKLSKLREHRNSFGENPRAVPRPVS